jgi:hypothetical protein
MLRLLREVAPLAGAAADRAARSPRVLVRSNDRATRSLDAPAYEPPRAAANPWHGTCTLILRPRDEVLRRDVSAEPTKGTEGTPMSSAEIDNATSPNGNDVPSLGASDELAAAAREAAAAAERRTESRVRSAAEGAAAAGRETYEAASDAASALADSGREKLTDAAAGLSEQFHKVSSYFENRNAEDVMGDVRRIVQRNPALFIAGGVAVGFALSRLLGGVSVTKDRSVRRRLFGR